MTTILRQLGGGRFVAMTGASAFLADQAGTELQFAIPRTNGINKVRIVLDRARDTYRVEFYRIKARGLAVDLVAAVDDVYADALAEIFTRYTGLATSL